MEKIMTRLGFSGVANMLVSVNALIKQGATLIFNQHGFLCYQLTDQAILVHFGLGYNGTRDYWKEKLNSLSLTYAKPVKIITDRESMIRHFDLKSIVGIAGHDAFYLGEL
ncbi:MAG: hypothetical protein A2X55_07785 [Nitrospirae bacterium GWB2_47_37]|nr:MAG: hypothetical protein A2X55_07785 [Nitrospirae bacterium GWB2_47_37]